MQKLMMALMALGISGGAAMAAPYHREPAVRDHRTAFERGFDRGMNRERQADRREDRAERFRDFRYHPSARYERHDERAGFRFVGGEWKWNGYEWLWVPGHYVRIGWRF